MRTTSSFPVRSGIFTNQETRLGQWRDHQLAEPRSKGDQIQLIFDADDYPEKELPAGDPSLVEELYQDEHVIIVNKLEGMKTHANEPTEIALLNHVSSYVGSTCYVVHRLDKETSGAILFAKNPFILPILNRILEDKNIQREYWALIQGSLAQKPSSTRIKSDAIATIGASAWSIHARDSMQKPR